MKTLQQRFKTWIIATLASMALASEATAATIGLNFTGANQSAAGIFIPDTMGAVGRDHIVEMLNGLYTVYDKATGTRLQRMSLNDFWLRAGRRGPATINTSLSLDPRVVYDPTADRWFAVAIDATAEVQTRIYLAASISGDPTFPVADLTRGWKGFALDGDPSAEPNLRWSDFPTLGVNADSISIATNLISISTTVVQPRGIAIYSIPKADLLGPTPSVANRSQFTFAKPAALGGATTAIQGVLDFGPADGRSTLFAAHPNFGLQRWDLLNTAESRAGEATLSPPTNIPIPPFEVAPPANQPGNVPNLFNNNLGRPYIGFDGTVVTDTLRFSANLVQQGNHAWGVHVAKAGDRSGLRWYEIDLGTNQLVQTGTISDLALDLIYPSIAVNQFGDAVIGFTATGENLFPSSYAVVGDTTDGVTTFGGLMELKRGLSTFRSVDDLGRNRWGDYSATVVDPSDPLRFWTFQEFVSARDQWAVQITEIIIPEPSTLALVIVALSVGSLILFLMGRAQSENAMSRGTMAQSWRCRSGVMSRCSVTLLIGVIVGSRGVGTATAGVIRHDVPDAQYRSLAAQPQFDPVAYLVDRASAVVIDPRWILMTGHTITNAANEGLTNLTFDVKGTMYTSRELIHHPQWTPGIPHNFDIGLARLTAPVSGIVPATRYRGSSEIGQVATSVGFGRTGTGLTGEIDGSHGTKRAGQNVLDVFGPAVGAPTYTVWADFDNPLNPAHSSWGSAEPLPLEYRTAPGDSGSGLFIDVSGQAQLAGIAFGGKSGPIQRPDSTRNADYGDVDGFTLVSHFNEWIDEQISTPTAYWSNVSGGSFASAQNWVDAIAPGADHTAVFNIARTYTVAVADPTINKHLRVRAGNVTIDLAGKAYSQSGSPLESSLVVGKSTGDSAQLTFKGGTVSAADASIAEKSGATGRLTIDGANTALVIADSLSIGGSPTSSGGSGTVRLVNGGMLDVRGTLKIWSPGNLDLAGGAATVASLRLDGGRIIGAGVLTLDAASGDAQINVTSRNPTISAPMSLADNTVITVSPATSNLSITGGLTASGVSLTKAGAGTVSLNNVRAAGLLVNGGAVAIAPNLGALELRTSTFGTLLISGATDAWSGKLDLNNSDAIVQSTAANKPADLARLHNQVKQGFSSGNWQGLGITSTTAANNTSADTGLSVVDNALLGYTNFSGQSVTADSILLRYTYYGDVDANGAVDADDLTVFANNFGRASGATQIDGDIDFNGTVDADDLTVFANNFNKGVGNPLATGGISAVPEPSTLALVAIALCGAASACVTRSRHRRRAPEAR